MSDTAAETREAGVSVDGDWEGLYIDGEWVPTGDREAVDVTNPSTGETITRVPFATVDDVDDAYDA
ncbi:aldehyde dehydrogenase, partial [Halobium palmae]